MGYLIILTATTLFFIRTVLFMGLAPSLIGIGRATPVGLNWQGALLLLLGLLLVFGFFQARGKIESTPKLSILQALAIILVCSLGSLATYYLNIPKGLGPFKASGLVGVITVLIAPKFAPCVYSASFAAMSSQDVLPTIFHSIIVGLIVGIVFILCRRVFNGFGGKLGVIAFFSVWLVFLVVRPEIRDVKVPDLIQGLSMILSGMAGSKITYILSLRMKFGPVLASSLVTLTGGLFLPFIFPAISESLTSALTAGSYAGMASKEIIPNKKAIGLAGIIAGIFLVLGVSVFPGMGGKLGVVAFMGVTCVWALRNWIWKI